MSTKLPRLKRALVNDDALAFEISDAHAPAAQAGKRRGRYENGTPRFATSHPNFIVLRLQAVTSHVAEYVQRLWWRPWHVEEADAIMARMPIYARVLIAAGRGPARIPTCEHILRDAPNGANDEASLPDRWRRFDWSLIVPRTLSLFGPGELQALRVLDAATFRLALSAPTQTRELLNSLRAVELVPYNGSDDDQYAAAIIERCASTVTELKGPLPGRLLCRADGSDQPPVLARCTRLEVLTEASRYAPAIWLGLSHLHTLRDVDLGKVSTAAIAAALPRLHTLGAYRLGSAENGLSAVHGFFANLLPRLRVFQFEGNWPVKAIAEPTPLPLLEELVWSPSCDGVALRAFLGARPTVLRAPDDLIAECLPGRGGALGDVEGGLLMRVRDVEIFVYTPFLSVCDMTAEVLRAAPRLRRFRADFRLTGDISWVTTTVVPLHRAFVGLVHPRLRCFVVWGPPGRPSRDEGGARRLRRTCFPRLRQLTVDDEPFLLVPCGF
jgi:hypothetical protein